MIATAGGTIGVGSDSPNDEQPDHQSERPQRPARRTRAFSSGGSGAVDGSGRRMRHSRGMSRGSSGTSTSTEMSPPRLTVAGNSPKLMPIELPTRNVAGSPTSVSSPAELLMMAVRISGPTKSTRAPGPRG